LPANKMVGPDEIGHKFIKWNLSICYLSFILVDG
jgi:hypothetical protein